MFIVLHVPSLPPTATREQREEFIASALAGIVAHNDQGDAIVAALELLSAESAETSERLTTERESDAALTAMCVDALAAHNGNVSAAARATGLARSTVRARAARWHAAMLASNDNGAQTSPLSRVAP